MGTGVKTLQLTARAERESPPGEAALSVAA